MNRTKTLIFAGALALAPFSPLWAQSTDLGAVGNTELQQVTGTAVQTTCGGFVADLNADPDNPDLLPSNIPLFESCGKMVHSARVLQGGTGPTGLNLGLSSEELGDYLQHLATEEFAATESMASEISSSRMDPVITRLVELRGGVQGFSAAALYMDNGEIADAHAGPLGRLGGAAGDVSESVMGGFINASYGTGDRDNTDRTNEFDFDSYNITVGMDYRFNDNLVVGFALNYYDIDSDFDDTRTVAGGDVEADGWGGALYGTWYQDNFYVDAIAGYAATDYDTTREISIPSNTTVDGIFDTATADPESDDYTLGVGAGYNFYSDALTWGPYFRATYINVDIDDYRESGAEETGVNLAVDGQEWESMTTVLGAQFSYAISQDFGVIVPFARLGWTHQFEDDSETMTAVYVDDPRKNVLEAETDELDSDYAELGVGVSAVFSNGLQAFVNYDTLLGLDELTTHLFTAGVRKEF